MNKEVKSALKKTAKIAGVTCVAAGAVAVMTSGAALKAIGEGGKYLANTVKKILKETDEAQAAAETVEAVETVEAAEVVEAAAASDETVAEEPAAEPEEVLVCEETV